jgi:excisionase family DNA binding protein
MSSNILIQRVCEFCGNEFTARTTVTKYCQHRCASLAYKARTRNSKIRKSNVETTQTVSIPMAAIQAKDFLKIEEVCGLLGISRSTVSRAIKENRLKAIRFGKRVIIKRAEIDRLF